MSTLPASTSAVPPTVRVCGEVDPADPLAEVDAAVIRHQLERRVGPLTLLLCSTSTDRTTGRSPWTPRSNEATVDVDLDVGAADTTLFNGPVPLAALFHEQVDPLSVDVRRRMRAHLDGDVATLPRTALDAYVAVVDDPGGADPHPGLVALRDGASMSTSDLHAEFDRLADEIRRVVPGAATVQSQQLIVDELRRTLSDERREIVQLSAAVQRLDDTIGVLTQRLAAADLDGADDTPV